MIEALIATEVKKWYNVLQRIIDVILFLSERGRALRSASQMIEDANNGTFWGLMELLSHWDPILKQHVLKVQKSEQKDERLQPH